MIPILTCFFNLYIFSKLDINVGLFEFRLIVFGKKST